jgi:hypothetical protein
VKALVDLVLLAHGCFALFTVTGGFLALRWRALTWLHLPCLAWGCAVEFAGLICPLTPLENNLRAASGEQTYTGDYLAHYLGAALYPTGLTRTAQLALGAGLIVINALAYALLYHGRRKAGRTAHGCTDNPAPGRR